MHICAGKGAGMRVKHCQICGELRRQRASAHCLDALMFGDTHCLICASPLTQPRMLRGSMQGVVHVHIHGSGWVYSFACSAIQWFFGHVQQHPDRAGALALRARVELPLSLSTHAPTSGLLPVLWLLSVLCFAPSCCSPSVWPGCGRYLSALSACLSGYVIGCMARLCLVRLRAQSVWLYCNCVLRLRPWGFVGGSGVVARV
jgi:hypothetical protein